MFIDNVMVNFMINNRTETFSPLFPLPQGVKIQTKTEVNLFFTMKTNCQLVRSRLLMHQEESSKWEVSSGYRSFVKTRVSEL